MRVAAVQMDISLGEVSANVDRIEARLVEAARGGAKLVVFPECAVTGYCFDGAEHARTFAQQVPGIATDRIARTCTQLGVFAVFGLIEEADGRLFNTAALVGPEGLVGAHRKLHLPFLGLDRFASPGDRPFAVFQAGPLRVGMLICYDASFPESARALALLGADLVALPTNWPTGSDCLAAHLAATRALENTVYVVVANRIGTERGCSFVGRSRICDPMGETLAATESSEETILSAEVAPERARQKHVVIEAGKHETDRFADRRPDMYTILTAPHPGT
jgi:predicted amidohydrolase